MDHRKKLLDLEIGDTIIWRDEGMRNEEGIILISPGMRGKVITRSENLLAGAARKAGLPITAIQNIGCPTVTEREAEIPGTKVVQQNL